MVQNNNVLNKKRQQPTGYDVDPIIRGETGTSGQLFSQIEPTTMSPMVRDQFRSPSGTPMSPQQRQILSEAAKLIGAGNLATMFGEDPFSQDWSSALGGFPSTTPTGPPRTAMEIAQAREGQPSWSLEQASEQLPRDETSTMSRIMDTLKNIGGGLKSFAGTGFDIDPMERGQLFPVMANVAGAKIPTTKKKTPDTRDADEVLETGKENITDDISPTEGDESLSEEQKEIRDIIKIAEDKKAATEFVAKERAKFEEWVKEEMESGRMRPFATIEEQRSAYEKHKADLALYKDTNKEKEWLQGQDDTLGEQFLNAYQESMDTLLSTGELDLSFITKGTQDLSPASLNIVYEGLQRVFAIRVGLESTQGGLHKLDIREMEEAETASKFDRLYKTAQQLEDIREQAVYEDYREKQAVREQQTAITQAALDNPYAAFAMQQMTGGINPFLAGLEPLGFNMPQTVPSVGVQGPTTTRTALSPEAQELAFGKGTGFDVDPMERGEPGVMPALANMPQGFFPAGMPTIGALRQTDPESLRFLNALLSYSGMSPDQFAKQASAITPQVMNQMLGNVAMGPGRVGVRV